MAYTVKATKIEREGRFFGMASVEVFNDEFYAEYVIDRGVCEYFDGADRADMDKLAFDAAKQMEAR